MTDVSIDEFFRDARAGLLTGDQIVRRIGVEYDEWARRHDGTSAAWLDAARDFIDELLAAASSTGGD